jgi:pyruvate dehydrogenase E2 component (dihydrolipoamide acetyltransferase)
MAQRLARAHAEVVPASLTEEADLQAWSGRADVTVRLARAIASGCAASPALNAWYDGPALARRLNRRIDLGIAVTTEDGLFVPVLRDVASRSAADLRAGLDRLEADLQARTIPPEELRGQTITLSNFGTLGGRFANLVVVPPQVAILGAGRIRPQVVAGLGGEPVVHPLLPLSLTFDHRAVTGGEAVAFLMAVVADLERAE